MKARQWVQAHPFTTSFIMVVAMVEAVIIVVGGALT